MFDSLAQRPILVWFARRRVWLALGLTLVLVVFARVRLRDMPLERDEGEYAYAGQIMLHGHAPYKDAYSMKLPGPFAAYSLIMAVLGQSPAGIHLGVMIVNLVSIVLLFLLGRKLLDDAAGLAAAMSFALLSLNPTILGLAGHATHFIVLFALAGLLVLVSAVQSPKTGDHRLQTTDHEPRNTEYATRNTQHGTRNTEHATRNTQHATRNTQHGSWSPFASGLLFGTAFLMKQPAILFGVFGFIYLAWAKFAHAREAGGPWLRLWTLDLGLWTFLAGLALPYAVTCAVLWGAGVFPRFIFWTVSYAAQYGSSVSISNALDVLGPQLKQAIGPCFILWTLPAAGLLVMWWEERLGAESQNRKPSAQRRPPRGGQMLGRAAQGRRPAPAAGAAVGGSASLQAGGSASRPKLGAIPHPRFFLTALLLCSLVAVSAGFHFRPHYFLMLLPIIGLLTGVAVSRSLLLLRRDRTIELFLAVPVLLLFVTGAGAALAGNGSFWFAKSPADVVDAVYGTTLFSQSADVAKYLNLRLPENARIAVIGSEPEIYFDSRRRSVTPYLYTYPLMESQPYARQMQDEMIAGIERTRPEYVVYVDHSLSWLPSPGSDLHILEWWKTYWASNLDLIVKPFPVTDSEDMTATMPDKRFGGAILVLKRKDER